IGDVVRRHDQRESRRVAVELPRNFAEGVALPHAIGVHGSESSGGREASYESLITALAACWACACIRFLSPKSVSSRSCQNGAPRLTSSTDATIPIHHLKSRKRQFGGEPRKAPDPMVERATFSTARFKLSLRCPRACFRESLPATLKESATACACFLRPCATLVAESTRARNSGSILACWRMVNASALSPSTTMALVRTPHPRIRRR